MDKLKRNKKLDGLLTDIKSRCMKEQKYTPDGILEGIMAAYKKYETKNYVVTSAEADNIISALKSMPEFSMEKFLVIFGMFGMENSLGLKFFPICCISSQLNEMIFLVSKDT